MRRLLTSFIVLSLVLSLLTVANANNSKETIVFQASQKSKTELINDARNGKKDIGIDIDFFVKSENFENNLGKVKEGGGTYTVQKLKEVKEGNKTKTSYVVVAIASDHDDMDPDMNPGRNFEQIIWVWIDKVDGDNLDKYVKATRYEAQWNLLDSNRLTIYSGLFNAAADGRTLSGKAINVDSPTTYTPPAWGRTYVKTPKWEHVNITGGGIVGGEIVTKYKAGSSTSTLRSYVTVN